MSHHQPDQTENQGCQHTGPRTKQQMTSTQC
jgi:hypothetical protein